MKVPRAIGVLFITIYVLCPGCTDREYLMYAALPHNIPSDIPQDVRQQIERLYDKDPAQRAYGASCLAKIGGRAVHAIPFLIGTLPDSSPIVRVPDGVRTCPGEEAATALSEIGKPAVGPLIGALVYKNTRQRAASALAKINDSDTIWLLLACLKTKDWHVRAGAACALGEMNDVRAVEFLIASLEDEHSSVQEAAARALGQLKDPLAVEPLIAALKSEFFPVRHNAAWALGELKDPRAVEPLITALKTGWFQFELVYVQVSVAEALSKITGKHFWLNRGRWRRWWHKNKESILAKP